MTSSLSEFLLNEGISKDLIEKLRDRSESQYRLFASGRKQTGKFEMILDGETSFGSPLPEGLQELKIQTPELNRTIRNFSGKQTSSVHNGEKSSSLNGQKGQPGKRSIAITAAIIAMAIGVPMCSSIQNNARLEKEKRDEISKLLAVEPSETNYATTQDEIKRILKKYCKEEDPGWLSPCGTSTDPENYTLTKEQIESISQLKENADKVKSEIETRKAIERDKAIADGSYMPSESEIRPACKKLVEERTVTGSVNWGWFNSSWFPQYKTLILKGKTKNRFGVEIPFSAECKWEKGGMVRLVEINE